jgi:5-methylcytosine-specific restriction endonuclease McrA
VTPPTADEQLRFLTNLQRLLAEGQFVATYKYALLLALADIAIESGDNSGRPLEIPTRQIAEKFVIYYWRQCMPYVPHTSLSTPQVLRQNTGSRAKIIARIIEARKQYNDSLPAAKRNAVAWKSLVRDVNRVVRQMPLRRLQTVGRSKFDFLYESHGKGSSIELRPGVAFCLRQFYTLIGDLVRGAWVRYVRRHNHDALGTTADLTEFLFGGERCDLSVVRGILHEVQKGRCFYCDRTMQSRAGHVDHFIPWVKYPLDLGHNFVVAHQTCNSAKADHLAAADFLAAWADRNIQHREHLAAEFGEYGVLHNLPTSARIADWAYGQAFATGGLTWQRGIEMVLLPAEWRRPIAALVDI